MAVKFDQNKVKHQLLHISLSLATVLSCMIYLQNGYWLKVGTFSGSVLQFVLIGEILKIILTKYFGRNDKELLSQHKEKYKKKSLNYSFREIFGGILLQTFCTILYAFICIILGAPVLQNYEETFVLSSLLTLMTVSPIVLLFGGSGSLMVCFCEKLDHLTRSEEIAVDLHKYHLIGTIFGAWAGSVVAPLDWDRDWQVYPIPNVVGALIGCGLLNMYACSKVLFTTGKIFLKRRT